MLLCRQRIDKELAQALAALDKEKESALSNLDTQVLAVKHYRPLGIIRHGWKVF